MSKLVWVLHVPVEGKPTYKQVPDTLKSLQKLVGGLIECQPLPNGTDLICNEEGKIIDLPYNNRILLGPNPNHIWWESIMGDYFVTGKPDDEGNTTDCPREQLKWLKGHLDLEDIEMVPAREELPQPVRQLMEASRAVRDAWESGDLQFRVQDLDGALEEAEAWAEDTYIPEDDEDEDDEDGED